VNRSLILGCGLCELELELPAVPFSGSKRRERGEDLCKITRPRENICSWASGGESGEKRERSREELCGGTAIDRFSLDLDEEAEVPCEDGVCGH
jgi:hypothetical protein